MQVSNIIDHKGHLIELEKLLGPTCLVKALDNISRAHRAYCDIDICKACIVVLPEWKKIELIMKLRKGVGDLGNLGMTFSRDHPSLIHPSIHTSFKPKDAINLTNIHVISGWFDISSYCVHRISHFDFELLEIVMAIYLGIQELVKSKFICELIHHGWMNSMIKQVSFRLRAVSFPS